MPDPVPHLQEIEVNKKLSCMPKRFRLHSLTAFPVAGSMGFAAVVSVCLAVSVSVLSCTGDPRDQTPEEGESSVGSPDQTRVAATLELDGRYPEAFSFLNGVRELLDGSVLAADPLSQILIRIDLDSSTADTLGRVGEGPQEYQQPDQVFPLPGDSSLLVDLGKSQLTTIEPDGTFGDGMPMMIPVEEGFPEILHPRFVDGSGALYHQAGRSRDGGPADSAAVTRFERASSTFDTVATLWLPENTLIRSRRFGYLPRLLEARDDWAVGDDGSVAVIRAADFSVEWTFPDGRRAVGPSHHFETGSVKRADKEALLTDMQNSAISMTSAVSRTGGVQQMAMSRGVPNAGDGPGVDDFQWSETFPVFRSDRTLVSPRGEAWVERWMPADSDSRWEVFDDQGIWMGSVFLPPGHRIIGFGQAGTGGHVVYVTRTDEYGLKWLERHRVVR